VSRTIGAVAFDFRSLDQSRAAIEGTAALAQRRLEKSTNEAIFFCAKPGLKLGGFAVSRAARRGAKDRNTACISEGSRRRAALSKLNSRCGQ
jgi:hypothetical protein